MADIPGQMAGAAVGGGLAILGGALGNKAGRDAANQNLQHAKELTRFNRAEQMQLWKDTNYSAQVEELKKAGLSVGLMYGKGGGGGATASVATGGSAQQASTGSYDMGMALQGAMQEAQIENIKADTAKKEEEAKEVAERTPTHAKGMEKTDAEIQEIATRMNVNVETVKKILQEIEESESRVENIGADTIKKGAETTQIGAQTLKTEAETKTINQMRPHEVAGKILDNGLTEAKINLTRTQEREIENKIQQAWEALRISGNMQEIKKFEAEIDAMHPGLGGLLGGALQNAYRQLDKLTNGGGDPAYKNRREAPTKDW